MKRTLFALAGLITAACAPGLHARPHTTHLVEAQTLVAMGDMPPGLSVTARTLAPRLIEHGAPVVTLTVANSLPRRRVVEVSAAFGATAVRTLVLEPGAAATADFALPRGNGGWGVHVSLREGAGKWCALSRIEMESRRAYSSEPTVNVLATPALNAVDTAADYLKEDGREESGSRRPRAGGKAKGEGPGCFHFHTLPRGGDWSADARAYAGYDIVLLTEDDWAARTPAERRALVGYAVQGGLLMLSGRSTLPEEACGFPARLLGGAGDAWRAYALGHGKLALTAALAADRRPPLPRAALAALGEETRKRLSGRMGADLAASGARAFMADLDVPVAPVALFLTLLAVFALGVVPAVMVVTIRRRRRLAALVALPLVALALALAVVLAILWTYGVTPRLVAKSLVFLNAADRRAAVETRACVFAPTDATDRLRFARSAFVAAFDGADGHGWRGQNADNLQVVEDDDPCTVRGAAWLTPLKPAVYLTVDLRDTAARLEVEELAPGRVKVVNLLGASLASLLVVDGRGDVYETADLPEGAARELAAAGPASARRAWPDGAWPDGGAPILIADLRAAYRAEMDAAPFAVDALGGAKAKRRARTVVYGRYGKGVLP